MRDHDVPKVVLIFYHKLKTKEEITLAVHNHGQQMAQCYPNLTSFQPCPSHPLLPSFIAGQVLRFVRLITHAAPHSENGILPTISFFICGSGIHATFRGDAWSKHSRDRPQPSETLGILHVNPVWTFSWARIGLAGSRQALAQLRSLTIGARPESVVVWSVAPVKPEWWNPWHACHHPRSIWLNPSTGALPLQP